MFEPEFAHDIGTMIGLNRFPKGMEAVTLALAQADVQVKRKGLVAPKTIRFSFAMDERA